MSVKRKEQIALIALSHIPNQTDSLFVNDIKTLKIKYVAPLYVHSLNGFMDSLSILQTDSTKFTVLPNNVSLDVEEVGKPHPFPMK
jgi:hypothetical protein